MTFTDIDFIRESNLIEGIRREPTSEEIEEFRRFMAQDEVTIGELCQFVGVYQPRARLRLQPGMDVRVGNHFPPGGGPKILDQLEEILNDANLVEEFAHDIQLRTYEIHHRYETLHPFTDGNGRSGRMLWMWMMREAPLGFLHTWYYQSLQARR